MKTNIKIKLISLLLFSLITTNVYSKISVKVGGYNFLPFVSNKKKSSEYAGISSDFVTALNRIQNTYEFSFIQTTSKRRYVDMKEGLIDMILFEDFAWGWKSENVQKSKIILEGGEVYVTKFIHGLGQKYFDDIKSKRIVGVLGYHYGFAGFNADAKYLKKNFDISLTSNVASCVEMILHDRAEIAVANISYLNHKLKQDPSLKSKIIRSDKFDQRYNLRSIISATSPVSDVHFNDLIRLMIKTGELKKLYKNYGIDYKPNM